MEPGRGSGGTDRRGQAAAAEDAPALSLAGRPPENAEGKERDLLASPKV
jgi:hypothetical protein